MPGVPIEIPSDTVIVLNTRLLAPAPSTPRAASRASSAICMLHGVRLAQVEATPICGLLKSASSKPTARNMAREGVCFTPSTTTREYCRGSVLELRMVVDLGSKRLSPAAWDHMVQAAHALCLGADGSTGPLFGVP